ncbi:unnamed protein product [Dimorphilus gyrociliatus]|uniref:Uncharacterized protein n=1 Tax=Dimorphilus gyrociliatus TaxID=2664684 RepID=A0A7I8W577_9ANNE|nr:unnamed protein product [Dimorphilus gyrociliatus]
MSDDEEVEELGSGDVDSENLTAIKISEKLVEAIRLNNPPRFRRLINKYQQQAAQICNTPGPDLYCATTAAADLGNTSLLSELFEKNVPLHWSDGHGWMPLHVASRSGRVEAVKFLIEEVKVNLDYKTRSGWTALHLAILKDHDSVAELLIRHRANVNAPGPNNWTPIHIAAHGGFDQILSKIIYFAEKRIDLSAKTDGGSTAISLSLAQQRTEAFRQLIAIKGSNILKDGLYPIHLICLYSRIDAFKAYIETEGYDLNTMSEDGKGMTGLHISCQRNDVDMVRLLLGKGADPNLKDVEGRMSTHYAAEYGDAKLMQVLLSHRAYLNTPDIKGNIPLHIAIEKGNRSVARHIIPLSEINSRNVDGFAPLTSCAIYCLPDIADLLISEKGRIDCNIRDSKKRTPLHHAANKGNSQMIRSLIKNGAAGWLQDENGKTPLHITSARGFSQCMKILLKSGSVVDSRTYENLTPLHMVANEEVCKLLLEHDATVSASCDCESWMPIHFAAYKGLAEVCELLLEAGAGVDSLAADNITPLHLSAFQGQVDILTLFLEKGAAVNKISQKGRWTSLHIVSEKGYHECSKILLDYGALPSLWSRTGDTSLHTACRWGFDKIVNEILNRPNIEIDYDAANSVGLTAVALASRYGHVLCVQRLIQSKVNIEKKDDDGDSPLHLAVRNNHEDVVKMLASNKADVNSYGCGGWTPLHLASSFGYISVIDSLLSSPEIEVDKPTNDENRLTAISLAAIESKEDCVRLLASAGAAHNQPSRLGQRIRSFLQSQ